MDVIPPDVTTMPGGSKPPSQAAPRSRQALREMAQVRVRAGLRSFPSCGNRTSRFCKKDKMKFAGPVYDGALRSQAVWFRTKSDCLPLVRDDVRATAGHRFPAQAAAISVVPDR